MGMKYELQLRYVLTDETHTFYVFELLFIT